MSAIQEKMCPKCGALFSQKQFVDSFCIDCFLKNLRLGVPSRVEIKQCSSCGRVKLREWKERDWNEIEAVARAQIPDKFPYTMRRVGQDIYATFETPVLVERTVRIVFRPGLCIYCSRKSGGYFEAVIQLRGPPEKVEQAEPALRDLIELESFIPRRFEKKGGIDLQVGSRGVAAKAIKELGYKPIISSSLYGVKAGKRIYRTTYCVRLGD